MKNLKILFGVSLIALLFCLGDIIFLVFFFEEMELLMGEKIASDPSFWFDRIVNLINYVGVFLVCFGLWKVIQKGPFEKRSSFLLQIGGILFLTASLTLIANDIYLISAFRNETSLVSLLTTDFMLLVIGIGTLFTADVLKSGVLIKQENDLTV
ncbi:DUF2975 domain-containing protein [Nonlabens antarcticus]|uniref:DUF2975 domain-containing protein n=1 Tax=Nonlabens antarcticus TaxID=392714 RepID=UPI0018919D11|nr:DUF2975 domain-containing protein [Nonlabens antarcticus]